MKGFNEIVFFKRIGVKLIAVVSITVFVSIGVYSYFNIKSQSEVLLSEVERHANQLSETVKNSTRYSMMLNQRDHIQEIIKTIGKDPAIKYVRIFNKEGEIIYSTNNLDLGMLLNKKSESCFVCHTDNIPLERLSISERTRIFKTSADTSRILGIINPIYNEKSCSAGPCHAHPSDTKVLGVLDVAISLHEIDKQISYNELRELIFAILSISAIGIIIGIFVRRWVDRPVKELVKATNEVALGNLKYLINEMGSDELTYLAKSFNNMTKKLDEVQLQLVQSDKMASLGKLAAGVAHEINNPLTGVLTYSSFLLKRTKDNPEMQADLNVIVRETMRSREIVKGLLDFARQSAPKKSSVNINEIINRAESVISNQLKFTKVVLEKKFDDDLPKITADANQIQQVFMNLFINAIDAIGSSGGNITITTSQISLSPLGNAQIKKAVCVKNHNLIDNDYKINGRPSLLLKLQTNSREGLVHIDPIYGSNTPQSDIPVNNNSIVNIACPLCENSIIEKNMACPKCGGPVYKIQMPGQGFIEGCASFKDNWQRWSFIDVEGPKKFVEINFSDTGSGIAKENIPKIFEPFFSTKGQKGTGLGLSVVWGIIDNHKGKISVQSEIGKGTTFSIKLPQG